METITISTAQNVDIEYEVAGLGERIAARLIDLAGFTILYIVVLIFDGCSSIQYIGQCFNHIDYFVCRDFNFYDLVCEMLMTGQSFGKKIMKIKVISLDGGQPTFGQYLMRWIFRIVDFGVWFGWGLVALISVAVTEKHQRIGDKLAKTTLIKTVPRTKIDNVAFSFSLPEDYEPIFKEVLHLNDRNAELVYEVLTGYYTTGNADLIYAMAAKIKAHMAVNIPTGMNELEFLETVMKDYKHITANMNV